MKKKLILVVRNHFDLMWRRPFREGMQDGALYYQPYEKLQELYLEKNLQLCANHPEYSFTVECVAILRCYLEKHPQQAGLLRTLAEKGQLYVPAAGENIIDCNLVQGESIVHNFVRGLRWQKQHLGSAPQMAVRTDAFGNSAQLPQILRSLGISWVTGLQYTECDKPYWRGIDGSAVYTQNVPNVGGGGGWRKYAACPACGGTGAKDNAPCTACEGTGLNQEKAQQDWSPIEIDPKKFGDFRCGMAIVGGEELLPQESTLEWAKENEAKCEIRFGGEEESRRSVLKMLERVDNPPAEQVYAMPELNPNNTGCYVSRIQCKQNCRRQENWLLALQALEALKKAAPETEAQQSLDLLWEELLFTMFHDAVTGTHVDAAYEELKRVWQRFDCEAARLQQKLLGKGEGDGCTFLNLSGAPYDGVVQVDDKEYLVHDLPPFSATALTPEQLCQSRIKPGKRKMMAQKKGRAAAENILQKDSRKQCEVQRQSESIENEFYLILSDEHGITQIWDKKKYCAVAEKQKHYVGEWVEEQDDGSPWATIGPVGNQTQLGPHTQLIAKEETPQYQRLWFEITPPQRTAGAIDGIAVQWSVTLYQGVSRVDFAAQVDWDCYQSRLRVVFPTAINGEHRYEIPFGSIVRKEYQPEQNSWCGANGDWPALNWAGVESEQYSVALLNRGTPSYKIQSAPTGDMIWLSLLRSPCIPTYLHEPQAYSMCQWDGMRDAGHHAFSYALKTFDNSLLKSDVVQEAAAYNAKILAAEGQLAINEAPRIIKGGGIVTSIERGEERGTTQLRIVETHGVRQTLQLSLPSHAAVASKRNLAGSLLMELPLKDGICECSVRPFEIVTICYQEKEAAL